jgi:hypothetical protein
MAKSIGIGFVSTAGDIVFPIPTNVTVNDVMVILAGSRVKPHGPSPSKHRHAHMLHPPTSVTANDIPICATGSPSSCGHLLISNTNVEVD